MTGGILWKLDRQSDRRKQSETPHGPRMTEAEFHRFIFSLEARGLIAAIPDPDWVN